MLSSTVIVVYVASLMLPCRCCLQKEYEATDGQCCPMCHEGTVVRRDCTLDAGTRCVQCGDGTYMNQPNGLRKCFLCTNCNQGLFEQRKCTASSDTVCDVQTGYFCRTLADGAGCSLAEKHTLCLPGQRVKEPGTSRTNTVCEDCQQGYFSRDGVNCTAWTTCSETQIKLKEGSTSSDVICGSASSSRHHYPLIPVLLLTLTVAVILIRDN
ncbi:tumor necrosis factor receptor superfamily member 5 isoform X3 [Larimichthys crocea]|uniref:tumor necrosis factor receptor superfamily member 5 isoform X3 n=1 Tax=Larimichthys crocea TaxID=215358 RepID=UPI000F5F97C9|nr:tumor necrosis factor receptor superfamily member 5 isoform X3 [Larimichthys crocea]